MGKKEIEIVEELKKFKRKLKKKFGVEKTIVFGSAARTKFKKFSDIDLIVVSDYLRKLGPYKNSILLYSNWKLDVPIDFICLSKKEFRRLAKRVSIVKEAVEKGIEI
jgi:predicted nucleotidyltransferase